MPRSNRFNPTFAERLAQSNAARSTEPQRDDAHDGHWSSIPRMMDELGTLHTSFATLRNAMACEFNQYMEDAIASNLDAALAEAFGTRVEAIPTPPPALDLPTMSELHAITPAPVPTATPQYPSAQLADPLTYAMVSEARYAAFMELLPLLKSLWGCKRLGRISNCNPMWGRSATIAYVDVYVDQDLTKTAQRVDISVHGFRCHVMPRRQINVELWLPVDMLTDERILPHLQDMMHVPSAVQPLEPKALHLYSAFANDGEGTLIPGVPHTAVSTQPSTCPTVQMPLDTPLWEVREHLRVMTGEYLALPHDALAMIDPQHMATHPHLAMKMANRGMIAFTRDSSAGQFDRQQVMKAGRFFKQYGIDTTDQRAKEFSAIIAGAMPFDIKVLSTREEYRWAYAKGPESCMSKGSDRNNREKFDECYVDGEWVHPIEVFAHPESDLRLVVVAEGEDIGARCWVNTATKKWARIYSSNNVRGAEPLIREWLDDGGYTSANNWCADQPLLRLDSDAGGIICPYIDPSNYGVSVEDDCLIIGGCENADHETGHLSSYNVDNGWGCDECDDTQDDNDERYETIDNRVICECCADRYYSRVLSIRSGDTLLVRDDELSDHHYIYDAEHLRDCYESYVYCTDLARSGLVELDLEYHGDSSVPPVANINDCVETADGWVLDDDIDHYDLIHVEDLGYYVPKRDCCVLIDADGNAKLSEEQGADTEGLEITDRVDPSEFDSGWDGITVYAHPDYLQSLDEADPEEDAA